MAVFVVNHSQKIEFFFDFSILSKMKQEREEKDIVLCEEDEIDLIELWQTLRKHKVIVFLTTSIFLVLAIIFIIVTKPKYEAVATLQIGGQLIQTGNGLTMKYFEDTEAIKEYLDVKYDVKGKYRKKGIESYIEDVSIPRKVKGFITITAYGPDNDEAIKTLKIALNDVLSKHRAYYDNIIRQKKLRIEELNKKLNHELNVTLPLLKRDIYILQNINIKKIEEKMKIVKNIDIKKIDERIKIVKNIDMKKINERIKFSKKVELPAILKKISILKNQLKDKKENLNQLSYSFKKIKDKNPALAAITALRINAVQNDIKNLKQQIIDYNLQIKRILEETLPNLEKQKQKILEETLPDLEKQKIQILKKQIPLKEAAIKQLLNVTVPHLKDQIKYIQLTMQPPYLTMTKIVGKIYTHDYPVKPKKKLILVIALITGLILGIFLVFFIEFIQNAKEREQQKS